MPRFFTLQNHFHSHRRSLQTSTSTKFPNLFLSKIKTPSTRLFFAVQRTNFTSAESKFRQNYPTLLSVSHQPRPIVRTLRLRGDLTELSSRLANWTTHFTQLWHAAIPRNLYRTTNTISIQVYSIYDSWIEGKKFHHRKSYSGRLTNKREKDALQLFNRQLISNENRISCRSLPLTGQNRRLLVYPPPHPPLLRGKKVIFTGYSINWNSIGTFV